MEVFAEGSDTETILQYRDSPKDPRIAEKNRKTVMDALEAVTSGDVDTF
jgi:hypothetical protein